MKSHDSTRRSILGFAGNSLTATALASLLVRDGALQADVVPGQAGGCPHHEPIAKRVIHLCLCGGVSHIDSFDYKPELQSNDGKSVANRGRGGNAKLLASPWEFTRHGQSGLWISELFPEVAKHADDLCLVRSMQTDVPAHPQAFLQMHTGSFQFVRPSLGAWTLYGLGTENENMPGFITLNPPLNNGGPQNFGSSFLPAIYQGTRIGADSGFGGRFGRASNPTMPNISNTRITREGQRAQVDFIQELNRERLYTDEVNPNVTHRVVESSHMRLGFNAAVYRIVVRTLARPRA